MDAADLARARNLVALDKDAQARDLLARVLAEDPENAEALCLMAQSCLGLRDKLGAVRAARAACRADPESEWACRLLALALARNRRADEAVWAATRAVQLEPGSWRTHVVRAEVDTILRAVTPTTESAAREAVRLAPHEAECHRQLGVVLLERKRYREARAALSEALRLDPQDAAARNDLARIDVRKRWNVGRAAAGFAAAAALDPTEQVAAHNLTVAGATGLRVVHLILAADLFTLGRAASQHNGNRALAGAAFAAAAVALTAFGFLVWRGARPRTLHLLAVVLRRDRMLAAWFILLVATLVCVGVATVVPAHDIVGTMACAYVTLFTGVLVTWVRGRRLKSAQHSR